jgi:uncharacterized protein YndB with AHSA1/START domain
MTPTAASVEISCSPADVFAYVTDPRRFAEWQGGVAGGPLPDDRTHEVGDRFVTTRRIGFLERPATSEITRVDPPHYWSVRGVDGPIRALVEVVVDPLGDGGRSTVTISIEFTGVGIGKLIVPLAVRPRARREIEANMYRLKQRLETAKEPREPH